MKLSDIISFRRDLLFNGAVQIGWLESDPQLAKKAAAHYAFHGPTYHGIDRVGQPGDGHQLIDTATFTLDVLDRVTGRTADDPFALAVAGYGTGKSHLGVTLASLLDGGDPNLAGRILDNLRSADRSIGDQVAETLCALSKPYLVVAINGMRDFDLTGEIVRQVMLNLRRKGLDTTVLEDLRPRFKYALSFTESFFETLRDEFRETLGDACDFEETVERLKRHDEETFRGVNAIYERRMGTSLRATGQESLHEFVQVVRETYCGENGPFAGMLILFDEFGRYMEFAVQKSHIAGPGALQQLFEAVQANADGVFLLSFIQYELKAYISRVAPELRDDLQRYVTRYDAVRKVRLSTNLETLIANLLEKRNATVLGQYVTALNEPASTIQSYMRRWFPEMENHAMWTRLDSFERVIREGCWPLHPLSTWLLYRLASVGKYLQQRSALSLLADTYESFENAEVAPGFSIVPVDLCNDALVDEFVASERFGQQGASASAYRSVLNKYEHQLSADEVRSLKAVMLMTKTGARINSKDEYFNAVALFTGSSLESVAAAIRSLESEKGALSWNEALHQYEILSDAVPRKQFEDFLEGLVTDVDANTRARVFSTNFARWFPEFAILHTDFGVMNEINTKEWDYRASFADVPLLPNLIELAFRNWMEARRVDEPKGQLIYCYVGPGSDLSAVRDIAIKKLQSCFEKASLSWELGAPIAISFLHDEDGAFGEQVAQYHILQQLTGGGEGQRYANFIMDARSNTEQELRNRFEQLQRKRILTFATGQEIEVSLLQGTLTRLFGAVYSKSVPFPFDGFSTAAGNAAKDCQVFTRELFLGHLDREWITAANPRQRNRAHGVLVESWDALDNAGAIRYAPANPAVHEVIDLLGSWLASNGTAEPLNLGKAIRTLCAPPYGCSIASAGLVLALFVSSRKNRLELQRAGQSIGMENWLAAALPGNVLDLSVLDSTVIVQVSEQDIGEWELLLNDWEIEKTYIGRVAYLRKALDLALRVSVPQALYYRFESLRQQAHEAKRQLGDYDAKVNEAVERVNRGIERDDLTPLSWGAKDLCELRIAMEGDPGAWTGEQIAEVERHEAEARIEIQQRFSQWLPRQKVDSILQLPQFLHRIDLVAGNLGRLGLVEEKTDLEKQRDKVEDHVQFLGKVHSLKSEIGSLIRVNQVNDSTPMSALQSLVLQVNSFAQLLDEARRRNIDIVRGDLEDAARQLHDFEQACRTQIRRHESRIADVYNARITSREHIHNLRAEVAALRQLFAGQDENLDDLVMVHEQLDMAEEHYRALERDSLNEEDFGRLLNDCVAAAESKFGDEPPLIIEDLYDGITETIRARRRQAAEDWMRRYVAGVDEIVKMSAESLIQLRSCLQDPPRLLSSEQMRIVTQALADCERRLDELEVEGLVAKFRALSEAGKQAFLREIGTLVAK